MYRRDVESDYSKDCMGILTFDCMFPLSADIEIFDSAESLGSESAAHEYVTTGCGIQPARSTKSQTELCLSAGLEEALLRLVTNLEKGVK
jgi:hypothetical protein